MYKNLTCIIYKGDETFRDIEIVEKDNMNCEPITYFEQDKIYILFNSVSRITFTVKSDKTMNVLSKVGRDFIEGEEVIFVDPTIAEYYKKD